VVDGRFLGLRVIDQTQNSLMKNAQLRSAMSEGYRAASSIRRHQMVKVMLTDGQHPDTSASAVIVSLMPGPHEIPDPPFDPVIVRLWQPESEAVYEPEQVQRSQLALSPDQEDLDRLRDVWSGHRYSGFASLARTVRRLLLFAAVAFGLVILAGAWRTYAWFTTRWDIAEDRATSAKALNEFRAARKKHDGSTANHA
jgi:hypothetical protein